MTYCFDEIKEHYESLTPKIISTSETRVQGWVTPYSNHINWMSMFSPIENMAWQVIRAHGKCPLYPQYPVGKYFVDFGNPFVKIAVECDGKEFHTDVEKDKERDIKLSKLGWTVFRISGADCNRLVDEDMDDPYHIETFYSSTIEGLIKSIGIFYFKQKYAHKNYDLAMLAFQCLQNRVSIKTKDFDKQCENILLENS